MRNLFLITATVFLLLSCKNNSVKSIDNKLLIIDINPLQSKEFDFNDVFSDYSFIKLETDENILISSIDQMKICNDRIYIFDFRRTISLHCFDMQGKHLFGVGSKGQGPGEYTNASDFAIDTINKKIWIGDDGRKILSYDLDGNFLKDYSVDFSIRNISIIPDSEEFFLIRFGYYKEKEDYSSGIYSLAENTLLSHINKISNFESQIGAKSISRYKDELLFGFGFNDTIYRVNLQDGFTPKYVLDFGENKTPESLLEKDLRSFYMEFNNPDQQYTGLISNFVETDNHLQFNYSFSGKHMKAFYSKSNNMVINISKILLNGKEQQLSQMFSYFDAGYVYSILSADNIIEDSNVNTIIDDKKPKYGVFNSLNELKTVTNADDNPIIVKGVIDKRKLQIE